MRGGIVWVCEHGHVDMLHRRSSLDLCMTCRDGVCEPRFTPGRRSKAQRERDKGLGEAFPRFEEERKNRRKRREVPEPPLPSTVEVSRRGQPVEVVDAAVFEPPPPVAPFPITTEQRHGILHGTPPRIAFPRQRPEEIPDDAPYPATKGDVLEVTDRVRLVVLGLRVLVSEIEVLYEIHDRRIDYSDPVRAFTPSDEAVPIHTLGVAVIGEGEPQPIPQAEATWMADEVHKRELEKLRRVRQQHEDNLKELASHPRDVRWPMKKTIEALNRRIDEIERQFRSRAHRDEVEARRAVAG